MTIPTGVVCPVATPLRDGVVDEFAMRHLLKALQGRVAGVVAVGSSGAAALLPDEVADQAVAIALDACGESLPVYVGVVEASTARALGCVRRRRDLERAAGILACGPYFQTVTEHRFLVKHFATIAKQSPVPVVLYNLPAVGYPLPVSVVSELSKHPNVSGIKDSYGDVFLFQQYLQSASEDFAVLQGREQLTAVTALLGGSGIVSALANIAPSLLARTWDATTRGDVAEARRLQRSVTSLATLFDHGGHWVSALMVALSLLGFGTGSVPAPLPVPDDAARLAIRIAMEDAPSDSMISPLLSTPGSP